MEIPYSLKGPFLVSRERLSRILTNQSFLEVLHLPDLACKLCRGMQMKGVGSARASILGREEKVRPTPNHTLVLVCTLGLLRGVLK